MTAPQSVTERYVSNLLHYGRNKEFDILSVERVLHKDGDEVVGVYFVVYVGQPMSNGAPHHRASGATISQALRRALEKHGVTFR